eukprot:TRINITY_DN2795_c0_g1_i1.p1 TRINITY_DN2795_c0_g1~~TRINITY_DN2795_c0_g1_i1.p1  ORF type:complete len:721 (+),score=293.91 TRINITY_DN2795_c0_g1_i1:99-2261(+)
MASPGSRRAASPKGSPGAKRPRAASAEAPAPIDFQTLGVRFHHVQLFADSIAPTSFYKQLEGSLNRLAQMGSFDPFSGGMRFLPHGALPSRVAQGREEWTKIVTGPDCMDPAKYQPSGQDMVEQLIAGLGWRLTAEYVGTATRSVLVASSDAIGVKFVVTTKREDGQYSEVDAEPYFHFRREHLDRFYGAHAGRPGVAVLGFEVEEGSVDQILERYRTLHPKLLVHKDPYVYTDERTIQSGARTEQMVLGTMKTVDVFAYYMDKPGSAADRGTVLRFVERTGTYGSQPGFSNPSGVLPGLVDVPARFDGTTVPCYSDHWVSNVRDRDGFIETLRSTLGFTPKVNFNAGVVAAGEAIIESTVAGNTAPIQSHQKEVILKDQSQVYLPINNALSEVGHVHGFIAEIGQGVQHLASRVHNLTGLIERVNNYRKITGRGFSFLNIPRSYYGFLQQRDLVKAGASEGLARELMGALEQSGLVSNTGIVAIDITDARIDAVQLPAAARAEYAKIAPQLRTVIKRGRYSNMFSLLRDHIDESKYLQIVENMVLVDIQGQDILYQIFTSNILQRKAGDEAPFLEFIERVCAECKDADGNPCPIRPGCGGFGIRNFLTLFLSIEVSKAMRKVEVAKAAGNATALANAQEEVDTLTAQMNESNPVLTDISDAMTAEGEALEEADKTDDPQRKKALQQTAEKHRIIKEQGQERLKQVSDHYKALMAKIRQK